MRSRFLTPDAGAAAGLIIGIILGSLAINLFGEGHAARAARAIQSPPVAATTSASAPASHK